jgi:hypothetical protein
MKEWEDERYYYVRLNSSLITYVVLRGLIENGLKFCIDIDDVENGELVIAFLKE